MPGSQGRNGTSPGDGTTAAGQAAGALVREGQLVRLRRHVPENRAGFQRWYADEEIARLLRHDQEPLNAIQSRGYFDTIILPLSTRGLGYAIHEVATDRLIGTTALTDIVASRGSALFRIVIGEKDCWGRGYGTEATRLVVEEAFERHGLLEVRLEVFRHNDRAIAAYRRVGFQTTGEHTEWVGRQRFELHVVEMAIARDDFRPILTPAEPPSADSATGDGHATESVDPDETTPAARDSPPAPSS